MVLRHTMGWLITAIKSILELNTERMNLPTGTTILTVLRTSGGYVKYGWQSSEGYINIPFTFILKNVYSDTITETKIFT
jgi:hypothetical protein